MTVQGGSGGVASKDLPEIAVVGIGASAGGIEALGQFFDAMPATSGCAFVVVLHLDPQRESQMARVLAEHTAMPVVQIEDGMRIAADHVYVIAPDTELVLDGDRLQVSSPSEPRGLRHPVDVLFSSIARQRRERAIAIVLSGTGRNGTEGLKEIRAEGGMSLVQEPESARFDGMPRSAIAADLADHVLAPEKMPPLLLSYVHHDYVASPARLEEEPEGNEATVESVLSLLRERRGNDFGSYKRNTLRRRIYRRMGLRSIESLHGYLQELRSDEQEVLALASDLVISVTSFFRDPEAWQELRKLVIDPLIAERKSGDAVRVWVPACATGEEAYSMAMLITERAEAADKRLEVKVFATDPQDENLRRAREGVYPAASVAGFPPERIARFFERLDGSFHVTKELRAMVVFANQDLLRDPPFSRLDIVSCRNLLIYLETEAQQRIVAQWHFALRPQGYLFLGSAETIGRQDDLFEPMSKKWRIFRRIGPARSDRAELRPKAEASVGDAMGLLHMSSRDRAMPIADVARRALLERYAPASVLIDQKGRVVYFHGRTRDYLEQPPGEPTKDVLAMARDDLALILRGALRDASKVGKGITVLGRLNQGGVVEEVLITVMPVSSPQDGNLTLITFAPASAGDPARLADVEEASPVSGERALEEELVSTRAELRNTIEHLEAANRELRASNEEGISMNEELQSTNEELETSKEELQSFNEELNTVNSQLQHKIGELERITNDLNNLLAGSETATLFLDEQLAITWFSPAIRVLVDLVGSDIGRPFAHFARKFSDASLLADAEIVLEKLTTLEAEVLSDAGRWYLRRMLPYRTRDNRIAGVVVSFSDITAQKMAALAVDEARIYAEAIIETVRQPVLVLDAALRILSTNDAFLKMFDIPHRQVQGHLLQELAAGSWDLPLRKVLASVLSEGRSVINYEVHQEGSAAQPQALLVNARRLVRGGGREELILLVLEDISERRRTEDILRQFAAIVASSDDAIISKTPEGIITSWNGGAEQLFGHSAEEIIGKSVIKLVPDERMDEEQDILASIRRGEHILHRETMRCRKDGSPVWVSLTISPIKNAEGRIVGASTIARDMTERLEADNHRKTLMNELNHRVKNTMAVIQSIASQTLAHGVTLEQGRETFISRLINLAKAHDVLTRESWQSADLTDIVADTLRPHADHAERFLIEGPGIRLSPSAALAVAMALHELATNAVKYGALSVGGGHVKISWRVDGETDARLCLVWQEFDGPLVAKPGRTGFGSRLIERSLASQMGGDVRIDYAPAGLVCTITAPLSAIQS